jgi:beta-lactam-binding protein with PASTA domain
MLVGSVLASAALAGPVGAVGHLVRIPELRGVSVVEGYARLDRDGLRVSVPSGFEVDDLASPAAVIERVSPAPGRAVRPGSTVALKVGCVGCGVGSPAVPRHIPTYKVPSFIGDRVSVPERWIRHKTLYETEYFGSLRAGTAPQLYDNYRIVRQHPSPGAELKLGIRGRVSATLGS